MKKIIITSLLICIYASTSFGLGFEIHKLLKYDGITSKIQFKDDQAQNLYHHLKSIKVSNNGLSNIDIKCMNNMVQLKAKSNGDKLKYTFLKAIDENRSLASGSVKKALKIKRNIVSDKIKSNTLEFRIYNENPDNDFIQAELNDAEKLNSSLQSCCKDESACLDYLKKRL